MPRKLFRKYLPDHASIREHRHLRWCRPLLRHHNLWHLNRHSVAGGVALGLFAGLIPGPVQMLSAAILAVVFRVNLPVAMLTTLYTNPFTWGPLIVAAYAVGSLFTGEPMADAIPPAFDWRGGWHVFLPALWQWFKGLGETYVIGSLALGSALAGLGYAAVQIGWRLYLLAYLRRRTRRPKRAVRQARLRAASDADAPAITDLLTAAFGTSEGPEIVGLIKDLAADATARPLLSLVATVDERVVGHVLFSKVRLSPPGQDIAAALLAPLAVHPDYQRRGIGGRLVEEGVRRLAENGTGLVFVLGHPGYYPRFAFAPAGTRGFAAPYPIPDRNAAAWMVRELRAGAIGMAHGQVICADALADPKYWRE